MQASVRSAVLTADPFAWVCESNWIEGNREDVARYEALRGDNEISKVGGGSV